MKQREDKNAYMRDYYARSLKHRLRTKLTGRLWIEANRAWVNFKNNLRRYGLTLDQHHAILESQDFLCGLCGEDEPSVIDHNHTTGKVRGILCRNCNTGFGNFREDQTRLRLAIAYAQRFI